MSRLKSLKCRDPFLREDEPWQHELWYGPAEPPPGSSRLACPVSRIQNKGFGGFTLPGRLELPTLRLTAGLGFRVKQVHSDVEQAGGASEVLHSAFVR